MFKNANEIRNLSEKFVDPTFQQGVEKVSQTIANNISNAAQNGRFSTKAFFEKWYIDKYSAIIDTVINNLKTANYHVSELFDGSDVSDGTKYFIISWSN